VPGFLSNEWEFRTYLKNQDEKNDEMTKNNKTRWNRKALVGCFVLLCTITGFGQTKAQNAGIPAGGKWTEFDAEDPMTAAKKVRFELLANNAQDRDSSAKITLYCTDGKLDLADFRPNIRLAGPNRPGFWGHFLSMDKGTTRELIGAHLFRVEFLSPQGPQIAEFSPDGLNLERVSKACGITPKKP